MERTESPGWKEAVKATWFDPPAEGLSYQSQKNVREQLLKELFEGYEARRA
ncbi:hypothetical protein GCM10007036_10440 [Alsobacter metallidurans]|uniref:Uncharacterized protein n=1 Tax=Alsobacter metallidurans TaxID=340221 RepID=A0A917I4W5_9HYPH|nr:hypothetical protein [Alsobacter metallidurans]GGH12534.1 hypothetical protein GCM10007036_10440 [Alsobacter metallidurans]